MVESKSNCAARVRAGKKLIKLKGKLAKAKTSGEKEIDPQEDPSHQPLVEGAEAAAK